MESKNHLDHVGKWKLRYGKYVGQTYGEVLLSDPDYCRWLANIDRNVNVRAFLKLKLGL